MVDSVLRDPGQTVAPVAVLTANRLCQEIASRRNVRAESHVNEARVQSNDNVSGRSAPSVRLMGIRSVWHTSWMKPGSAPAWRRGDRGGHTYPGAVDEGETGGAGPGRTGDQPGIQYLRHTQRVRKVAPRRCQAGQRAPARVTGHGSEPHRPSFGDALSAPSPGAGWLEHPLPPDPRAREISIELCSTIGCIPHPPATSSPGLAASTLPPLFAPRVRAVPPAPALPLPAATTDRPGCRT
jgi:hypothetical protein